MEGLDYGGNRYMSGLQALYHQKVRFTGADSLANAILTEKNPQKICELANLIDTTRGSEDTQYQYMVDIMK